MMDLTLVEGRNAPEEANDTPAPVTTVTVAMAEDGDAPCSSRSMQEVSLHAVAQSIFDPFKLTYSFNKTRQRPTSKRPFLSAAQNLIIIAAN